ncbi:hypothetical protein HZC08_00115, partial [Candidatus Micrarchaeota archaeon]|nr:hypothetical protein [Candidatus Micrarchaeota archaeon]
MPIYGNNNISNVSLLLPSDGNYILTAYINPSVNGGQGSMPLSSTIYSANLSSSSSGLAAGRTFVHTVNFTTTVINISGTLTASGNSTSMNFSALRYWVTGGFGAFYGSSQDGSLEDPTDSRTGCTATSCYLASANGSYLAKMIGSAGGVEYVLYAEGFDTSGNYYGAMQNLSAKSSDMILNLTLRRLLRNITNTSYRNDVNGSRFLVTLNNTAGATSFTSGFMDFTVTDTNSNGAVSYKMFIGANASGHFYFPLIKNSYVSGTMYTPSYSPRKFSINAT